MASCRWNTATFFVEISGMKKISFTLHAVTAALMLLMARVPVLAQSPLPAVGEGRMPITTNSAEARAMFEQGVFEWENLHIKKALEHWQAAIEKDPNFMLAHLYVSERIPDPDRQATELKRIMSLMDSVTPDERLMAEWVLDDSRNDAIGALAAMNELLARYPKDKHLYWFAALSVGSKYHQWERAAELAAQAVQVDPDFA